jgi:hypothetical protein
MPYGRMAASIAAEWRTVERSLLAVPGDSHEAELLRAELRQILDEYRRLVDDAYAWSPTAALLAALAALAALQSG